VCLAIYKPAEIRPDWERLQRGFNLNDDGAGFAAVVDGKLVVQKGFFKFTDFRDAFEPLAMHQAAIHFRLKTHGERDADNCHPFLVTDETAMIHNGILNIQCSVAPTMSDTWHYANLVLAHTARTNRDFFLCPGISFLGEQAIGTGNKFVFLRADGEWGIWNEKSGHWNDGCWYSNSGYSKAYGYYTWAKDEYDAVDSSRATAAKNLGWTNEKKMDADTFELACDTQCDSADDTSPLCPDNDSVYYSTLPTGYRWHYDDLLRAGWSIEDIDNLIRVEGQEGLEEMAELLMDTEIS
jgi:glutamine amidotransferase